MFSNAVQSRGLCSSSWRWASSELRWSSACRPSTRHPVGYGFLGYLFCLLRVGLSKVGFKRPGCQAAFGNPDRAVEYLMPGPLMFHSSAQIAVLRSGIPAGLMAEVSVHTSAMVCFGGRFERAMNFLGSRGHCWRGVAQVLGGPSKTQASGTLSQSQPHAPSWYFCHWGSVKPAP